MRTVSLLIGAVLAALLGAGCGTFSNLQGRDGPGEGCSQGPPKPFGGVSRDIRWTNDGFGVFLFDVPLSLVGDLATLPIILLASPEDKQAPATRKEKDDAARRANLAQGVQDAQDRRPGDPRP